VKATNVGGNLALRRYVTVPSPQLVYAFELDVGEEFLLGLFPPGAADARAGEQSVVTAEPGPVDQTDDPVDELLR